MAEQIKIDHITKIEGHARLRVKVDKGKVLDASMDAIEGSRYFEAIVKGRKYDEVAILMSRICGTCSPIHNITALMAVEAAFGVQVSKQTETLRELLILGSTIQNHAVHLYFLALPDYLGYGNAIEMLPKFKKEITAALRLKGLGNRIVKYIGGREVHPVTPVLGGFSKLPDKEKLVEVLRDLKSVKKDAILTVKLFKKMKVPKFERKTRYFALKNPDTFSYLSGEIGCLEKNIPNYDYQGYFKEYIHLGSTAKLVTAKGQNFMVGALARINNNHDTMSKDAQKQIDFDIPCYNPFYNNVCQAIEIVNAVDRSIEILKNLTIVEEKPVKVKPKAKRGVAVTEAPRGLLFHDYHFDKKGYVTKCNVITPTAQNLANIGEDVKAILPPILSKTEHEIIHELEKLIRAYDPCISCSTHFLELVWE